jgi:hypothetical protein
MRNRMRKTEIKGQKETRRMERWNRKHRKRKGGKKKVTGEGKEDGE